MSLRNNKYLLLVSAVIFIFILIPCSFAGEINENQTDNVLTNENILTAEDTIYVSSDAGENGDGSQMNPYSISKAVEIYNSSKNSNIFLNMGNIFSQNKLI